MKRKLKNILALQIALITYLVGCVLWYFFWYKNGQLLHIALITLVTGSISVFIGVYKESNIIFSRGHLYKTISIISLIIGFVSFVGAVNYWCNKRVSNILDLGPTKRAYATVIAIDFKSTRSGKQAWSIVNYNAIGRTIEQSFADTSRNLKIGKKYLIKYSLNYPDMFKILDESK